MGEAKRERERPPLSQERVLQAALALCDAEGIAKLSMRRIAQRLGVEAMSLYHHVANKDAILDGLVDAVFAEIALPPRGGGDWRAALALRCHSARAVLLRHGWAVGLLDSRRNPGPATIRHHDAVIGCPLVEASGVEAPSSWLGAMVADLHRTLLRGGIFAYPADLKNTHGKLRLLYEASPMAFVIEHAGGAASTGTGRVLDVEPTALHQRTPVFIGSKLDVEDAVRVMG